MTKDPIKRKIQKHHSYLRNKDSIKIKHHKYYLENKEKIKKSSIEWGKKNPEKVKFFIERWQKQNRKKININLSIWQKNNRNKIKIYKKTYLSSNINGLISERLRSRIGKAIRSQKGLKSNKTLYLLGTDIIKVKEHLEKKFLKGMTWDNYGYKGWHIDHIKPLDSFNLCNENEQKKACNYKNLQPLWWKDNLIKKNKII